MRKSEHHEQELSHSMVHYLLTIHKLKENRGYARITDIAKDLELTKGSVSTAVNGLKKKGFVKEEDGTKFLNLTSIGHDEVHQILSSRTLLFYFMKDFLGVSEEIAERDSCMMEHLLSEESRQKFFSFMKDLACNHDGKKSKFQTSLDICKFANPKEFIESQMGDSYLSEK